MRVLSLLLIFGLLPISSSFSQQEYSHSIAEAGRNDSITLFQSLYTEKDEFLEMTIRTDSRRLIRKKYKEEYQSAELTVEDKEGRPLHFSLKLRSRGNVRKQACYYPPVKLNFKKPELREMGFDGQADKIKLVLQCRNTSNDESYLLKEYLIYKLYSFFTPHSFRVQLVKVNLEDTEDKAKNQSLFAFIIEPSEELAARCQAVMVERESGSSFMLEREPYKWMSAFQYMVGNTDWSPRNVHNMEFMKVPEYDKLIPVPYDFDYAGLVETDYAIPSDIYPIESVRERYYVGFSYSEADTEMTIARLKKLESPIMDYCRQFEVLDESARKDVMRYLEKFFDMLDHPRAMQMAFQNE